MTVTIPEQDQSEDAVRFIGRSFLIGAESGRVEDPTFQHELEDLFEDREIQAQVEAIRLANCPHLDTGIGGLRA